jgi:hypothetical protein
MLIPTFSPQGDGNAPVESSTIEPEALSQVLIPTFSPQGDGNASFGYLVTPTSVNFRR